MIILSASVWFVSGKYPKVLMDAWDEYNDAKNSENDRPGENCF